MGSFARSLGLVARRSLETESAVILKEGRANKVPGSLSHALDGTLNAGHDMKVFGLGTLAALAHRPRYARFTASMLGVYEAMERELDAASLHGSDRAPAALVWDAFGPALRRAPSLRADLKDVIESQACHAAAHLPSPATQAYLRAIERAGQRDLEESGATMLGHLYCRYFADLFGGQMLGGPTNAALGLPPQTPRHYRFDFQLPEFSPPSSSSPPSPPSPPTSISPPEKIYGGGEKVESATAAVGDRRLFIEALYRRLNMAGAQLSTAQRTAVVEEALLAFQLNAELYAEEKPLYLDAARGALNVVLGTCFGAVRANL